MLPGYGGRTVPRHSTLNDVAIVPDYTAVNWDTRYEFKPSGRSASLKIAVMDMFNVRVFLVLDADAISGCRLIANARRNE